MYSIQGHTSVRIRQVKWYAPHPPWLLMPDKASEHTCRRRQRFKDSMLRPGGGGSGGALPETPGQKYRLNFLSVSPFSVEMTRHHMPRSQLFLLRHHRGALCLGHRTARMEQIGR